jgi:hypothetical protein
MGAGRHGVWGGATERIPPGLGGQGFDG